MASPNLGIVHIAAAQNQPEVTANGAVDALDNSINLDVQIPMADADTTLTQAQLASGGVIVLTGTLTANRKIIIPAVIGRLFVFQNATFGGFSLTVQTSLMGTTVVVPGSGNLVLLYSDGTNVMQVTGGTSSGGGGGGGGGGTVPNFADEETPTGTIDGSNTAFTLANAPSPGASLILVHASGPGGGGVLRAGGIDFTLTGASIAMVTAPAVGDTLLAWYRH